MLHSFLQNNVNRRHRLSYVTGINGRVVSVTVLRYKVRGTVRALQRAAYVQNEFAGYKDFLGAVKASDIVAADAFDAALKG